MRTFNVMYNDNEGNQKVDLIKADKFIVTEHDMLEFFNDDFHNTTVAMYASFVSVIEDTALLPK
jgi:hypothetical protein